MSTIPSVWCRYTSSVIALVFAFFFALVSPLCLTSLLSAQTLVVLDPGHGGVDPGAVGCQREEATHVLDVAQRTKSFLETAGLQVELTRTNDSAVELRARAAFANERQATAFVSIHANANSGTAASGTETWIAEAAGSAALRLAELVQAELIAAWGLRDRGVKRANFTVLTATSMPAALTEIGFINRCDLDSELIGDPSERQEIARAHALGISAYLDAGEIGEPGGAEGPNERLGTLIGVTFEDTGAGLDDPSMRISGVEVTVEELNQSVRSANSTGAWTFEIPTGRYTVRAQREGFQPAQRSCEVSEGQTTWCSIGLSRQATPMPMGGEEGGSEPPLPPDMDPPEGGQTEPDMGPPEPGGLEAGAEGGVETPVGGEGGVPYLPVEGGAEAKEEAPALRAKKDDGGCDCQTSSDRATLDFALLALLALLARRRAARLLVASALIGASLQPSPASAHVLNGAIEGGSTLSAEEHSATLTLQEARPLTGEGFAKVILSPQGDRALLVHQDLATLSVLELSSGELKTLARVKGAGRNPQWHQDGEGVALHSPEQRSHAEPMIHLDLSGQLIAPPLSAVKARLTLRDAAVERLRAQLAARGDKLILSRVALEQGLVAMWAVQSGLWLYRSADDKLFSLGAGGHPSFSSGGRFLVFERSADDGASLYGADLFQVDLAQASPVVHALTTSADRAELAPSLVGERLAFVDAQGRAWLTMVRRGHEH